MLFESETFRETIQVKKALASYDSVFRYCIFEAASLQGGDFGDTFISCEFRDVEWYWGLFNLALFSNCKFERCTFRGTAFSGCKFVESTFTDCHFVKDNLSASCDAPDTILYACIGQNCEGWNELFQNQIP